MVGSVEGVCAKVFGAQSEMDSLALWMAERICSLLPYLGLHACSAVADQYLVGVAGWIFSGILLLMLMGVSDEMERRKAARSARELSKSPAIITLAQDTSVQQTPRSEGVADPGRGRPTYTRVRRLRSRRHRFDQGAYVPKPIAATNAETASNSST